MSAPLRPDPQEIRRALVLLYEPGEVVEVRALDVETGRGWTSTFSGYFDDPEALIRAVVKLPPATAIYCTLNRVEPALLARAKNRIRKLGKKDATTSDRDITRRRLLLVDTDPARPSGISSSDDEHEAALARAQAIRDWLTRRGWPAPILADSGNGGHLMYRIDLPADDEGLIERCLKALNFHFGDEGVTVDESVFNPARISKLYGTPARKGDHTDARPHRLARILDAPDSLDGVPRRLLEKLAATLPADDPEPARRDYRGSSSDFDIERWIDEHLGDYTLKKAPWNGGHKWIFDVCPFNSDHTDRSAVIVERPGGKLGFTCHHNGCNGKDWRELREKFEPGCYDRKQASATNGSGPPPPDEPPPPPGEYPALPDAWDTARGDCRDEPREQAQDAPPALPGLSLVDLLAKEFEPVKWIVPNLLPEGVTLLVGSPKMGKSWLCLDLALSVAMGGYALGKVRVERGSVLYLALEDNERRLQNRCRKLLQDQPVPRGVRLSTEWARADEGAALVEQWIQQTPDARLVIVDTLAKMRPPTKRGNLYEQDYHALAPLKALSDKYGVAIIVVHHTRKGEADDPLELVSGTQGLAGGVDTVMVLKRERGASDAVVHVAGREMEDQELALVWNAPATQWVLAGDASAYQTSKERREIIDYLLAEPGGGPKDVADALGKNPSTVRVMLREMEQAGQLYKEGRGCYYVSPSWAGEMVPTPPINSINFINNTNNINNINNEPEGETASPPPDELPADVGKVSEVYEVYDGYEDDDRERTVRELVHEGKTDQARAVAQQLDDGPQRRELLALVEGIACYNASDYGAAREWFSSLVDADWRAKGLKAVDDAERRAVRVSAAD